MFRFFNVAKLSVSLKDVWLFSNQVIVYQSAVCLFCPMFDVGGLGFGVGNVHLAVSTVAVSWCFCCSLNNEIMNNDNNDKTHKDQGIIHTSLVLH